jgi:hypothetical protein
MARIEQRRFVQHWRAAGTALSWRTRTTIPVASCVFVGLYSFSREHSQADETVKTLILLLYKAAISHCFWRNRNLLGLRCNLGVIAVEAFLALIFNCETGPQRRRRHLCRRGCTLFRGGIHKPIETIKTFILFLQKAAIFDCFRWNRNLFGLWRYLGVIAIQPFFALIFDVKTASQCL